jgi:DNA polymerase-4
VPPTHVEETHEHGQIERDIIHLDMDAFYAAVEVVDNPELRGKPVIVGGGPTRGVVSSASYEARIFGIHSAQPIATAVRLCPHAVVLPVSMRRYREVSDRIFEIFRRFTPIVEAVSVDEAFLDVTESRRLFGTPEEIAVAIKGTIRAETGLTVSAGVGQSKLVAKIASEMGKPDGLTIVTPKGVRTFLDPLHLENLPGVGRTTKETLATLGVTTIGELRRLPRDMLEKRFGKHGRYLYLASRGIDDSPVEPEREAKSIGREETFPADLLDLNVITKELLSLSIQVARRMRCQVMEGRTITLKVKYHDFEQITRAMTLPSRTDDWKAVFETCCALLPRTAAGRKPVRLLGVSVSHLVTRGRKRQLSLFEEYDVARRRKDLNRALDAIRDRFGEDAIVSSRLLEDDTDRG